MIDDMLETSLDISSLVTLIFRTILYASIVWTVWNVVLSGLKIAGAGEDADKRKEGIQAIINAIIGLVVALLAFGIVATVTSTVQSTIETFPISSSLTIFLAVIISILIFVFIAIITSIIIAAE